MKYKIFRIVLNICIFFIFLFPIKNCLGKSWKDYYKDYKDILGITESNPATRCEYNYENSDELKFNSFRFIFTEDDAYTAFKMNDEGNFNAQSYFETNYRMEKNGVLIHEINVSNFKLDQYLENYKQNGKCPTFVYFCNSVGDSSGQNIDLLNQSSSNTFNHTCYKFTSSIATEEELTPNGCHVENAKSCKNYTKSVHNETLYIELGKYESGRNYVAISYDSKFSPSAISPDAVGIQTATLADGDSVSIIQDDSGKTIFDIICNGDDCTYPSDISIVYSCAGNEGDNYLHYIFDNNSTWSNANFSGELSGGICVGYGSSSGIGAGPSSTTGSGSGNITELKCPVLLGDPLTPGAPAYYLRIAFSVIRYVAIIVLIVFTVIDFITATAQSNEDALKKATNKAIIRLVLCIIIFLLPTLITFILKYLNNKAIDLCGIEG